MSGYEVKASKQPCPGCAGMIPAEAVICTRCGLNLHTGGRVREAERDPADVERKAALLKKARAAGDVEMLGRLGARPPASVCGNCGYDLTGLPTKGRVCPECGQTAEGRRKGGLTGGREERREVEIASYWRTTLLVGLIGGVAGLAVTLAIGVGVRGASVTECFIHLGICGAALFVGYLFVCLFIGFEEDIRGLALRLVGVAAVWAALLMLGSMIPLGGRIGVVIAAAISVCALVVPLQVLTDRDWNDCYWIAGASWFLYFVASIVVSLL